MINPSNNLILIDGENKTFSIENIYADGYKWYRIKFRKSRNYYRYGRDSVEWLTNPVNIDVENSRIFIRGKQAFGLKAVHAFRKSGNVYWHAIYSNGYTQALAGNELNFASSCLANKTSKNVFEYLKAVAATNILGKEEENSKGILYKFYEKIDFIDNRTAIAPYLNPTKKLKQFQQSQLIFPFGSNSSQSKAVKQAFTNQISIIQGPPGTGKTQTILNIIANLILNNQTVLVVSNNNSATENVLEKLDHIGLGFIVATLGSRENKQKFIENQPKISGELPNWKQSVKAKYKLQNEVKGLFSTISHVYEMQEELAASKQILQAVELEWNHFQKELSADELTPFSVQKISSSKLLNLWLKFQIIDEQDEHMKLGWFAKLKANIQWKWIVFIAKHQYKLKLNIARENLTEIIAQLQIQYYLQKIKELETKISRLKSKLKTIHAKSISQQLTDSSMLLFKAKLADKYAHKNNQTFSSVNALQTNYKAVQEQYPVILSTTFSSRNSLAEDAQFDYLIMDEASQVSIETGALALSCAKNAVIVGDSLQLTNIVTHEEKLQLDAIAGNFNILDGYDCANKNFLQSVIEILPDAPQTLLREHYRCHPHIINFCNQKFYGGNLLIMTDGDGDANSIQAIKTPMGNHARGNYNQREIDVIKKEVLPKLSGETSIGIISPYNAQVEQLSTQLPEIESATVHKFQGREKDTIIMSVVDNQITEFSDDPNLLNVAVSRAKKQFCLVVSGNEQALKGNISDLLDYIAYNNFSITESKVHSIFDHLYSQYTQKRLELIKRLPRISTYDSENITYALLEKILKSNPEFGHLSVLSHVPLRHIIKDSSILSEADRNYALHKNTHVDFLIISKVSKKPILVIETDGYAFHHEASKQHQRDIRKNRILAIYELPLLRLSTVGSDEENKIREALKNSLL